MVVQSVSISREDWAYIFTNKKSPTFLLRLGAKVSRILEQEAKESGIEVLTIEGFIEKRERTIAKLNQRLLDALDKKGD